MARYLVAAGLHEDPEQAYLLAQEARKLAARVGVVREACGIAAYRAGQWAEALAELRAAKRLTGHSVGLPLIADSERALGRLDKALAIVHDPETGNLDRATQIELRIVESGIRRDQGMADAAVLALQVPELNAKRLHPWSARLFYAYADALAETGRTDEARDWFARAAGADTGEETDAAERYEELDDVTFEDLAAGFEDSGDEPESMPVADLGSVSEKLPAGMSAADFDDGSGDEPEPEDFAASDGGSAGAFGQAAGEPEVPAES
ncbi:MAG TPA: tetratricopeptide repeat protein [Streptosporangiaceae bacterium]